MRAAAAILLLVALAAPGLADDWNRGRGRPDVDVFVPVDPYEHERLYWSDGKDHHRVPGTVTINGSPYVCDRDGKRFDDRDGESDRDRPRRLSTNGCVGIDIAVSQFSDDQSELFHHWRFRCIRQRGQRHLYRFARRRIGHEHQRCKRRGGDRWNVRREYPGIIAPTSLDTEYGRNVHRHQYRPERGFVSLRVANCRQ